MSPIPTHPPWLVLILVILATTGLAGQSNAPASFQYLGKKEGLSQSSVFTIAQDSTGYLWFGTRDGLNKFDGYRMEVFRKDTAAGSLVDNDVRMLYVDPLTKQLWVGTISGLSRYDEATERFHNYVQRPGRPSLAGDVIRCAYRSRAGDLWVGTSNGLSRYQDAEDRFEVIFLNAGSTSRGIDVTFITETDELGIIIGTDRGLYHLPSSGNGVWMAFPSFKDLHVTAMEPDGDGNFWVGTREQGLRWWNPASDEVRAFQHEENKPRSLSHNNIRALSLNAAGDLWVGSFEGLDLLQKGASEFLHYRNTAGEGGLRSNSIRSLLIDRAGSLWVGTYNGGLHHLDEGYNKFTNYRPAPNQNSLSAEVVSSFAEDSLGNLWVGTEGAGLDYFNREANRFRNYPADPAGGLSGNNVKQLLLDGTDLWIGTFSAGLNRMDTKTGVFEHFLPDPADPSSLSDDNVYGIQLDGNHLWVLTYGGGLNIMDIRSGKFIHYRHQAKAANGISSDLTRVALKTRAGQYWIGTDRGLNKVALDGAGLPAGFRTFLQNDKIYCLYEDAAANLWVGTFSNGLLKLDREGKVARRYSTKDGLPDNTIFGILEAAGGTLWLSTGNGISRFDPDLETFTNYDSSNGLENLEFNFNAYFKGRSGEFFFGGLDGFTRFVPEEIRSNAFIPPVVLTGLVQNNERLTIGGKGDLLSRSLNTTESLTFKYNEADFTIQFAALDYFSPENNRYAYMLEGLDRDWNYTTGKSEAAYTIQREGDYTFLLRGGNSDGVWNERVRRLEIRVLPPLWRTWWAYLLYAAAIAAIIFGLVRYLRLRHRIQLQEIAKRQQEELTEMKLRFFTNITHELRTPLTLILGPLQQLAATSGHSADTGRKISLIDRNARRLLSLVNQLLTFRKLATDHEPIAVAERPVATFARGIYESFSEAARARGIDYTLTDDTDDQSVWIDEDKMEKVLFNLLSNAFKFTPDGGSIHLSITESNQHIIIRVADTGPGVAPAIREDIFKRFYEKSPGQQSYLKNSGIGLAVSRQMVALHHGSLYVSDDPADNESPALRSGHVGAAAGAVFVVELRKGHDHFTREEVNNAPAPTVRRPLIERWDTDLEEGPVSPAQQSSQPTEPTSVEAKDRNKLLVVDDNPGIREYVQSIFEADYLVVTAESGVSGLAAARADLPDIIISDIMMPEMDGLEFCRAVKTDLHISHIPVILLTARVAEPLRIEGLRTGADDYVTKPFHPEELRLRVRNILRARSVAREKFARVLSLDPKEITVTNADEAFLEQALAVVEDNMGNVDFKVDEFATALAVSRSLLFTKLKSLAGQTPNNFVKTVRLKRAAQLLESGQLNVGEVADRVGFRDAKYFRKVFKKHFNEAPSRYGKEQES